jgi:acyl-CoA synthetase (NDP forming)
VPGPQHAHIVDAATERGIPSIRLTEGNLVQLGYGINQRRIWTAETDQTSAIAEEIASDKDLTKSLLKSCGVPVPEGELVRSAEQAWEAAQEIGVPVVLKPYDGNHGRGVSLNLMTQAMLKQPTHWPIARVAAAASSWKNSFPATSTACWWWANRWWRPRGAKPLGHRRRGIPHRPVGR